MDYTKEPLSRERLEEIVELLGAEPRDLLRKRDRAYKELGLGNPDTTDDQILDAMAAHPNLIQRPIVVRGDRAVLGRPPERVRELL